MVMVIAIVSALIAIFAQANRNWNVFSVALVTCVFSTLGFALRILGWA